MKRIFWIGMLFCLVGCQSNEKKVKEIAFFEKGMLSKDSWLDSLRNKECSKILLSMAEPSIRNGNRSSYSCRLTVIPSYYNAYSIRIDKTKRAYSVSFKISGDCAQRHANMGLAKFFMCYESRDQMMHALFDSLTTKLKKFDFYSSGDDENFVTTGGLDYYLEEFDSGSYRVVTGPDAGEYQGKAELMEIASRFHSLIPEGILIEPKEVRRKDDLRFTVFRRFGDKE
jgi:hypothetical protein